jgi:hypothetical protein
MTLSMNGFDAEINSSLREHGWHVDVSQDQISHAIRVLNCLFRPAEPPWSSSARVQYSILSDIRYPNDKRRVFTRDGVECACFDLWGNLVVYHEAIPQDSAACKDEHTVV